MLALQTFLLRSMAGIVKNDYASYEAVIVFGDHVQSELLLWKYSLVIVFFLIPKTH